MFDGFKLTTIETDEVTIRLRTGGSGPPLLLLHGFPQTHAMWSKIAPRRGHALLASRRPIPGRNAHFSPAVVGHRPRRAHTHARG